MFFRDPIGFLRRGQERYGDVFTARFPGLGRVVYVVDPAEAKRIFTGSADLMLAGQANARWLEPVLGRFSILNLDGDAHLRQRRLLLPPFHGERIKRYEEIVVSVASNEIDSWPVGQPFKLLSATQRITLEIMLRAVFGVSAERLEQFRSAVLRLDAAASFVIPIPPLRRDLGRFSPWRRFLDARAALDKLFYEEIASGRADERLDERDDVLSLLLQARHEDGQPMSDREVRDEVMSVVAAGYETTATALAWSFERILRTPRVLERLLDDPRDEAYLDAVVKETLRVRSPVTDGTRVPSREIELCGYTVPPGTLVIVALPLLHLRPETYPEPLEFRPERFLEGESAPYAFVPFGGGVRRCVGAAFAQFEMRLVMRTVLERARLRAASPEPERQQMHHVVVVPARGTSVVLEERRDAPAPQPAPAAAAA